MRSRRVSREMQGDASGTDDRRDGRGRAHLANSLPKYMAWSSLLTRFAMSASSSTCISFAVRAR